MSGNHVRIIAVVFKDEKILKETAGKILDSAALKND
jgi:hypothetical protein